MKTPFHKNILPQSLLQHIPARSSSLLLLLILCGLKISAAEHPAKSQDTIVVNRLHGGNKYKIRIYPNATHEVLFFTANGEENKVYQLFLFDVDGKLVKQTAVNNRQTGFLSKLIKGNYVYEVFSNDERIEDGHIVIK